MSFRRPDFFIGERPKDAAERAELARQHRVFPPNVNDSVGQEFRPDFMQKIQSSSNPTGKRFDYETYEKNKSDEYVWWPENTTIDDPSNLQAPYARVSTKADHGLGSVQLLRFIPVNTTLHIIGIDNSEIKTDFNITDAKVRDDDSFLSTEAVREDSWFDLLKCNGTAYTAADISRSYYQWVRYFGPYSTVTNYVDSYVNSQGIANVHTTEMNGAVMFDTQSWWNVWKLLVYGAMRYNETDENKDAWLALLKMPQSTPGRYLALFTEFKRLVDSSKFARVAPPRNKGVMPHPDDMKHTLYTDDGFDYSETITQEPRQYMLGICIPNIHWPHAASFDYATVLFGYDGEEGNCKVSFDKALANLGIRYRDRNTNLNVLKRWFGKLSGGEGDMSLAAMAAAFESDERQDGSRGTMRGPATISFYDQDTAFDLILYSLLAEHGTLFDGKIQPTTEYSLDESGEFETSKRSEGAFYNIFPSTIPRGTAISTDYQVKHSTYTGALFCI